MYYLHIFLLPCSRVLKFVTMEFWRISVEIRSSVGTGSDLGANLHVILIILCNVHAQGSCPKNAPSRILIRTGNKEKGDCHENECRARPYNHQPAQVVLARTLRLPSLPNICNELFFCPNLGYNRYFAAVFPIALTQDRHYILHRTATEEWHLLAK